MINLAIKQCKELSDECQDIEDPKVPGHRLP